MASIRRAVASKAVADHPPISNKPNFNPQHRAAHNNESTFSQTQSNPLTAPLMGSRSAGKSPSLPKPRRRMATSPRIGLSASLPPHPSFCELDSRMRRAPKWSNKTLAGLMADASKSEEKTKKGIIVRPEVGTLSTNANVDFETFIVAKGPKDRYFRSNPTWIARHVVSRFRNLLIRLKDQAMLIDYSLMAKGLHQVDLQKRMITANEAGVERSARFKSIEERAKVNTHHTIHLNGMGGKAATSTRELSKKTEKTVAKTYMKQQEKLDRDALKNTLTNFPFARLRPHGHGSMTFREVTTYFQRELKCRVVRSWSEVMEGDKTATLFAEFTRPVLKERTNDMPAFNDRGLQEYLRSRSDAVQLTEFWFGDDVPLLDPFEGKVWGGGKHSLLPYHGMGYLSAHPERHFRSEVLRNRRSSIWTKTEGEGPRIHNPHADILKAVFGK